MEQERKIRVAITHGDTNAVGYEVIIKAFEDPTMLELCTPIIYGSAKIATYHAKALGVEPQFTIINKADDVREGRLNLLNVFNDEAKIELGQSTHESGEYAMKALDRALSDYNNGLFDVLVTAPVSKNSISGFNGHTAYITQQLADDSQGLTILLSEELRVALVTNNVAIKDLAESITKQKIIDKARIFHNALRRDLRISSPRIAVLGLNPRCGEDGILGDEEQEVIKPAVDELEAEGIQAFGPYSADDFFGNIDYVKFDGVLAMYHDQGQTPFKALAKDEGVRYTAGLKLVRTAPTQGPSFELAGRNMVDACSFRHAIFYAIDIWRNRQNYDEPLSNPLPKLYHEKRDESEKVRFRSGNNERSTDRNNERNNSRSNERSNDHNVAGEGHDSGSRQNTHGASQKPTEE